VSERLNWTVAVVLIIVHALAALAVWHFAWRRDWGTLILFNVWLLLCGLAITAGYHRLFSHPTYRASWPVRLLYVLFGAASVQGSVLKWSADHREHHAETDDPLDPYNIQKGFWWAHVGWILHAPFHQRCDYDSVRDLYADSLVRFQHRHYLALAFGIGFLLPLGIGFLYGDPLGALLCAGFLRLALQWHGTWAVNSVAHYLGRRPYDANTSARDSWITALVTFGEGYHNYHHRFPIDYRNGVRWYHFDPTKWFIWALARLRLASRLRSTPPSLIEACRERVRTSRDASCVT